MSLYGVMRTSTSGMSAQANRLATVADNIANVNTTGYKRAGTEFSSLLIESSASEYTSGSVLTDIRHAISQQGSLQNTTSLTDLAVSGDGFFIVTDPSGTFQLTRAGSFVPDGEGNLINAAGYRLMGYPLDSSGNLSIVVNGYNGLVPVRIDQLSLSASPSTDGTFIANLPSEAGIVAAADLPSLNAATAQYTGKSSLITYDNLGKEVIVDLYFSKTAADTWEVTAFDRAAAAAGGGFPYTSGPLATDMLDFDPTTGQLTAASVDSLDIPVPGGATMTLDLSQLSQLATGYTVLSAAVNGNPPSGVDVIEIARDGTVYATYENGRQVPIYQIPLAHVASPDKMLALAGNVFSPTSESGDVQIGFAENDNLGSILTNTLEQSNVDLATELTNMIDSQRSYTANSKVFQTGSELMDVLINLKR